MASRGRPKKQVDNLYSSIFSVRIMEETYKAMEAAAGRQRIPIMQWVRVAIDEKLRADNIPLIGLDKTTGMPNQTTARKTVRQQGKIVAMDEIMTSRLWEPIRTFIKMYVEVCGKHEKLSGTLKYVKVTRQPYFNRVLLKRVMEAFNDEGFDGLAVIEALDNLDWYNGDDPNASWGSVECAHLGWLMEKKARQDEPNWGRLLKAWRINNTQSAPPKAPVLTPQAREVVKQIANEAGFVQGSNDWAHLEQFVIEKTKQFGIEIVRRKASEMAPGPLGHQQFMRSFA